MAHLKTRYRKMNTGGAVPEAPAPADASALRDQITTAEQVIAEEEERLDEKERTRELRKLNTEISLRQQIAAKLEADKQAALEAERIKNDPTEQLLANFKAPELAKQWLRKNPEYLSDTEKNQRLQALHYEVVDGGFQEYSQEYFDEVDRRLLNERNAERDDNAEYVGGANSSVRITEDDPVKRAVKTARAMTEDDEEDNAPIRRRPVVSAPPSREVPSSGSGRYGETGKVTLSRDQKEAARIAGVSESEYAFQLLRLMEEKRNGNYHGGQP